MRFKKDDRIRVGRGVYVVAGPIWRDTFLLAQKPGGRGRKRDPRGFVIHSMKPSTRVAVYVFRGTQRETLDIEPLTIVDVSQIRLLAPTR